VNGVDLDNQTKAIAGGEDGKYLILKIIRQSCELQP